MGSAEFEIKKPYTSEKIENLVKKFNQGRISYYHLKQLEIQGVIKAVKKNKNSRGRPQHEYVLCDRFK